MRHYHLLVVILGSFALTSAICRGEEALPNPGAVGLTPSERYDALVARSHHEQAKLQTLEARFVQRKESEFLLEPEESTGTVWYQLPNRVRWDFASPTRMSVIVSDREMTTWYRDTDRVERLDVGRHGERFMQLLGPGSSLAELQRTFEIHVTFPEATDEPYRLNLTPLSSRLRKRLRTVNIHLDPELYIPVYLRYEEASGDQTEFSFDALQINVELPEDQFQLPRENAEPSVSDDD